MAQEWNIRPRGHVCNSCGKTFVSGESCVSALRKVPDTYERLDFHPACWENPEMRDWEPFSLWESTYIEPPPASAKEEPIKKEGAESLLRHLIDLEDPAMQNVIYILAVMLERSKELVERDTKPHGSGGILRIYEHRKSGDTFVLLDPRLRMDQLPEVQQQVVALLSGTDTLKPATGSGEGEPSAGEQPETGQPDQEGVMDTTAAEQEDV